MTIDPNELPPAKPKPTIAEINIALMTTLAYGEG